MMQKSSFFWLLNMKEKLLGFPLHTLNFDDRENV